MLLKNGLIGIATGFMLVQAPAQLAAEERTILIIGDRTNGGGGVNEYFQGVRVLETLLSESDALPDDVKVESSPFGWPEDDTFENAVSVVLYHEGGDDHPLLDRKKQKQIDALAKEGVGIVALHHVAVADDKNLKAKLEKWLGGAVSNAASEANAVITTRPSAPDSAILKGVNPITYLAESHAMVEFSENGVVTPLLNGTVIPLSLPNAEDGPASDTVTVAWKYERPGGGRSFVFTGARELRMFDVADFRAMLVNAVFWSAGLEATAASDELASPHLAKTLLNPRHDAPFLVSVVTSPEENGLQEFDWGHIDWHVSGPLGNSDTLTTGIAHVNVGAANPRHYHPNCDEVLHVLKGHIRHTMDDVTVEMKAGDTVSIPKGVYHNATNIGDEQAVLLISFDTAWREVIGE